MVLGALAVQEDEPELLQDLHKAARAHAFTALGAYQPFAAFGSRCEQVIPIRLKDGIRDRLDQLAHATHRSKSFLAAQAQEVFVENSDWQVAEIQSALRDADVADYASDQDVANLTFKWQVRAP